VEKRQRKAIAEEKIFASILSFSQCHLSFYGGEEVVKRRKYVGPLRPHALVRTGYVLREQRSLYKL